jgi:lipid-A-disaccharide synthase
MSIYIIAGEPSGDLHGANLIKALRLQQPELEIFCWGGEKMESAGGILRKHYKDLAFMGFWEVIKNLGQIKKNFDFCKKDILDKKPEIVVMIDYPGFNLRMARWLKHHKFKVHYYISPQLWAWKEGRVNYVKKYVDEMMVILPFEKAFYQKHNYNAHFVGHPLLDEIKDIVIPEVKENIIAFLPGSRTQEIEVKLPIFLSVIKHYPDYKFIVAGVTHLGENFYKNIIGDLPCEIVMNDTYTILQKAKMALVTSGTATLETALFKVPQIVCYKGSWLSYQIGRRLIKVKYISLVNLIMDREVVKELIQDELNEMNLVTELNTLMSNTKLMHDYDILRDKLGSIKASESTAKIIIEGLNIK